MRPSPPTATLRQDTWTFKHRFLNSHSIKNLWLTALKEYYRPHQPATNMSDYNAHPENCRIRTPASLRNLSWADACSLRLRIWIMWIYPSQELRTFLWLCKMMLPSRRLLLLSNHLLAPHQISQWKSSHKFYERKGPHPLRSLRRLLWRDPATAASAVSDACKSKWREWGSDQFFFVD